MCAHIVETVKFYLSDTNPTILNPQAYQKWGNMKNLSHKTKCKHVQSF